MEPNQRMRRAAAAALAAFTLALGAAVPAARAADEKAGVQSQAPRFFVVLYAAGPSWKQGLPMTQQDLRLHALYYKQLLEEGRVLGGGRFEEMDGGMALLRAASLEEAQAIVAADPAVTRGVFTADLRVWTPRFYDKTLAAPAN